MRIKIGLQLKKTKKRNDCKCPVYARFVMDGRRVELSTSVYVLKEQWDSLKQQIIGNSEDKRILNNRLTKFISHINDTYNQLGAGREDFDIFSVKEKLTGKNSRDYLIEHFEITIVR